MNKRGFRLSKSSFYYTKGSSDFEQKSSFLSEGVYYTSSEKTAIEREHKIKRHKFGEFKP